MSGSRCKGVASVLRDGTHPSEGLSRNVMLGEFVDPLKVARHLGLRVINVSRRNPGADHRFRI
jgi:hypothetical protein